ncbi:MAG: RNA-binding S4 domain-containing protein [Oscillospiraceae bacterium]|nr:RNA-binding S4 domain-containing protein [Oscillospiraceae bacterium]
MQEIYINPPFIKLEQFLKFCSLVSSGGEAKMLIQGGKVLVNGETCLMRGKKLFGGEKVTLDVEGENQIFKVAVK